MRTIHPINYLNRSLIPFKTISLLVNNISLPDRSPIIYIYNTPLPLVKINSPSDGLNLSKAIPSTIPHRSHPLAVINYNRGPILGRTPAEKSSDKTKWAESRYDTFERLLLEIQGTWIHRSTLSLAQFLAREGWRRTVFEPLNRYTLEFAPSTKSY